MARCRECIHFGVCDNVILKLAADTSTSGKCKHFIDKNDAVSKSEVEALQEALSKAEADVKNYMKVAEYQQSLSVKRYHEIKRLKEDIERLQFECLALKQKRLTLFDRLEFIRNARTKAITEFADRLRSHYPHTNSILKRIDCIEKEMTEEQK